MRVLAVLVLVAGFLVVWGGFTQPDVPDDVCPTIREGQGYTYQTQWWPPGTVECVVTGAGDDVVATRTNFPWRDYLTVVLVALAVAVLRLRALRILASLALFLAAFAVFFVGFDPQTLIPRSSLPRERQLQLGKGGEGARRAGHVQASGALTGICPSKAPGTASAGGTLPPYPAAVDVRRGNEA